MKHEALRKALDELQTATTFAKLELNSFAALLKSIHPECALSGEELEGLGHSLGRIARELEKQSRRADSLLRGPSL